MKIPHKVNHGWAPDHTDAEWSERVTTEAEVTTERAAREYAKAELRLQRAQERAEKEERRHGPERRNVRQLWAAVEERRQELLRWQAITQASPGGPQTHRPVPDMRTL